MIAAVVQRGQSLDTALAATPAALRPGVQALAFSSLRGLGAARARLAQLATRTPPPALQPLLWTALALLAEGRHAPHTLVDQAVASVRRRQPNAAGFVNAVLRRALREPAPAAEGEARWNLPAWWIDRLRSDWPDAADALLAHAHDRAAMVLRVQDPSAVAAYRARLGAETDADGGAAVAATATVDVDVDVDAKSWAGAGAGADAATRAAANPEPAAHAEAEATRVTSPAPQAQPSTQANAPASPPSAAAAWRSLAREAIVLPTPRPVDALPGWAEGAVAVQDLHAQLAAPLLLQALAESMPGQRPLRLLDACCAPGGKTAHLAALAPDAQIVGLDRDPARLERARQGLARLRVAGVTLQAADAAQPATWWDGVPFDGILLDAPCSGSGVVRRHPDIAWLRRASDLSALVATQAALLDALWPLLRPGGVLLYATCSVFRAEGSAQIEAFLQRKGADRPVRVRPAPGHLLPLPDNGRPSPAGDGFFYALLQQAAA